MANDQTSDKDKELRLHDAFDDLWRLIFRLVTQNPGSEESKIKIIKQYIEAIDDFATTFSKGTSGDNSFLSLSEIEYLVLSLQGKHRILSQELVHEKMRELVEKRLLEKKKQDLLKEEGIALRIWRSFPRSVMTVFGPLKYERTALLPKTPDDYAKLYALTSKKMVFPFDEAIGVDVLPFKVSVNAMLEIAHWVQEIPSYEAAGRAIRRNTAIQVNDDTIRHVANHIGQVVFEEEQNRAELAWKLLQSGKLTFPTTKKKGALYLEIDGAMVHIRRQKEERPAAESETKSTWMENKLGMVFSSDNFIWWKDKKGERQHKIGKREYVSYLGEAEGFKKQFWAMALRNGYGTYEQTVLISDGATWIRNLKEEIFPDAQQILDFYHLCEAVGEFAKAFFKLDESKYKPWSDKMCELLRASRHQEVLDEINRLGKHRVAKIKPNLYNYIENNKNNIDYSEYKRKGWYIGSGAIESGNKTVLQRRLKQAGMRWNIENAQYIVSLMSKAKSDLWVKDVVHLVKSRYETRGAFKSLDGPLMLKLDFWESLLAEKGPFSLR